MPFENDFIRILTVSSRNSIMRSVTGRPDHSNAGCLCINLPAAAQDRHVFYRLKHGRIRFRILPCVAFLTYSALGFRWW